MDTAIRVEDGYQVGVCGRTQDRSGIGQHDHDSGTVPQCAGRDKGCGVRIDLDDYLPSGLTIVGLDSDDQRDTTGREVDRRPLRSNRRM